MSNGSSFFASTAQPLVTPFPVTAEDERFARAVITAHVGKDMLGASKQLAIKIAEQHVSVATERYVNRKGTSLDSIAGLLGGSRVDLLPYFRQAAEEGKRVRLNDRFAIELNPERLVLIAYPA